jgi:hypothetical protein
MQYSPTQPLDDTSLTFRVLNQVFNAMSLNRAAYQGKAPVTAVSRVLKNKYVRKLAPEKLIGAAKFIIWAFQVMHHSCPPLRHSSDMQQQTCCAS